MENILKCKCPIFISKSAPFFNWDYPKVPHLANRDARGGVGISKSVSFEMKNIGSEVPHWTGHTVALENENIQKIPIWNIECPI